MKIFQKAAVIRGAKVVDQTVDCVQKAKAQPVVSRTFLKLIRDKTKLIQTDT